MKMMLQMKPNIIKDKN